MVKVNQVAAFISFSTLKALILLAEAALPGHGTGADKKALVTTFAVDLAADAGHAVAANNSRYADAIGAVVDSILPTIVLPPAPVPAP